jgi:hypothetical protein
VQVNSVFCIFFCFCFFFVCITFFQIYSSSSSCRRTCRRPTSSRA